jgi:uncharacterized protein
MSEKRRYTTHFSDSSFFEFHQLAQNIMKFSQFNNMVLFRNKHVLYNTLTDNYLILEHVLSDLIEAARNEGNVAGLEDCHPEFYYALIHNGFVVSDDTDEILKVKEIREQVDFDNTTYHLVINPTMNCNFKCWYCYESHIKDSRMSPETIENIKRHLLSIVKTNKELRRLRISWFGGEPLLYFDKVIVPVLKQVTQIAGDAQLQFFCDFTTNGYLITPEMIQKFTEYHADDFQITLDGNRNLHDTVRFVSKSRGSFDEIIHNIKLLCRARLKVTMRINFTKTNLNGLEDIINSIIDMSEEDKEYISISFHRVWQEEDKTLDERVVELVNFFRSFGFRAYGNFIPDTLRSSCYADKSNHATFNYNGEVYKCTARNFSSETKEGDLNEKGEIEWNGKYKERLDSKFKNAPCLKCSILPLCNGGCSQLALESRGKDYCVYDFDESVKKGIVLKKFLQFVN